MSPVSSASPLPFPIAPLLPHIREYRDADAETVAHLWRESATAWPGGGPGGGEHSTAARVRQEQRDLNTLATLLAFAPDPEDGAARAVGYCSLFEYTAEASTAYVGTLSVHPAWHGKGMGRDLLKVALDRTVALGYTRLDLNTWAGNLKAVPLYKKSGYFWAPETTVHMENYLPLIFRLGPVQAFLRHVDWYRDFQRDLSVKPDEEKQGKLEVYTYTWERDGRRLRVVIDRRSKGVVALETDEFALSTTVDDPRLPIGGQRHVRWRVENRRPQPIAVSLLAEGEDSVRCTFQASAAVAREQEWTAPVTAEQPQTAPPPGRPTNRVRATAVLDGEPIPLALGTQVSQPVAIRFDSRRRWLAPGVAQPMWITAENELDEPVRGAVRLAATTGLEADRTALEFDLGPRRRASWPVRLRAAAAGAYTLRAQATAELGTDDRTEPDNRTEPKGLRTEPPGAPPLSPQSSVLTPGLELRTKVFEQPVHCGEIGEIVVEQTEDQVVIATDRLILRTPLRPSGEWAPSFRVSDRDTGKAILTHSCSLGPPFVPSVFTTSIWTPHVERTGGSVTVVLSTVPPTLPGLTFERRIRLAPTGLIGVTFRATNTGDVARSLRVSADTGVDLSMAAASSVAAPLASGLVVDDAMRFPDWQEPDAVQPERYAETWMAEFGDGWVGATIWQEAYEVYAGWFSPSLILDLGTIPPGGRAETPPLYLYAGQGGWETARALWRQWVAPQAPARDPAPRRAHTVRLERFAFDEPRGETRVLVESERTRTLSGSVSLEAEGAALRGGRLEQVRLGAPHAATAYLELPARAQAVPATLVLDHERATERYEAALIRAGDAQVPVSVAVERDAGTELVRLENGRLRLVLAPAKLGRVVELSAPDTTGDMDEWVNQLYASYPQPGMFVWFNPWFGGIHPSLYAGGRGGYPGRLVEETFTWQETERRGAQGVRWRGIRVATETRATGQAGLKLDVSYLTVGQSNLLAVVVRLENRSGARVGGELCLDTFLEPGGDRRSATLHYERLGLRNQKRVHGGMWSGSGRWCALEAQRGPVLALVSASPGSRIQTRDIGLEGAHPMVTFPLDLAPDEALEGVAYLVLAGDLTQARLYRFLADIGELV